MSVHLKNEIFVIQEHTDGDVEFYKVTRSTTNTCEIETLRNKIIHQGEEFQYVEPDPASKMGKKLRCKVLDRFSLEVRNTGATLHVWDGKPVKQRTLIIFLGMHGL